MRKLVLRFLLAVGLLVVKEQALAQAAETGAMPMVIGVSSQNGFIISHTGSIRHLAQSHPGGAELNVQWQTTGQKEWHQHYKYPKLGLSLLWYDYHNEVLGHSFALSPYVNKTMKRTRRSELTFRLGTGIAYFTNKFDLYENHKNSIISSSVNAVIQGRLEYYYLLSENISLMGALAVNHYSNGATSKPNMGINIPTVSLGVNYHTDAQQPFKVHAPAEIDKKVYFNISATAGFKQLEAANEKKYLVNSVMVSALRQVNYKSNLLVGAEGFYDRSLHRAQELDTALVDKSFPDVKRVGVVLGHELLFGRVAFITHLGVYVYRPYKYDTFYYERLGLKYQLSKSLFTSLDLKVHRGTADVIEFRIGAIL